MKPNSILPREGIHTLPLLLTPNCKTHDAATCNSPPIIPYAKLNIGKKITGLEIMKLNRKKIQHYFQTYRTDVYGESHCLQGCFRKQTSRDRHLNF